LKTVCIHQHNSVGQEAIFAIIRYYQTYKENFIVMYLNSDTMVKSIWIEATSSFLCVTRN